MRYLLAAALALLPAAALAMDPGEWQISTTMTSPMFPKPQSMTQTQCIKAGESGNPSRLMGPQQGGCTIDVKDKSATGYAWDMVCAKQGMRGSGRVTFTGASMQGEVKMSGDAGGRKFEMQTTMSGKRLGPCK